MNNPSPNKRGKKVKQIPNQGSILNFMIAKKSATSTSTSESHFSIDRDTVNSSQSSENDACTATSTAENMNVSGRKPNSTEHSSSSSQSHSRSREKSVMDCSDNESLSSSQKSVMYSPIKQANPDSDSCIYVADTDNNRNISKVPDKKSVVDCSDNESMSSSQKSVMYSPIKQGNPDSCIYIADTDTSTPCSSQESKINIQSVTPQKQTSVGSRKQENPTVASTSSSSTAFASSDNSVKSNEDGDELSSSQKSLLYTPIKKARSDPNSCIYISDSSPQTPRIQPQSIQSNSHTHADHSAVKKLFEGQKALAAHGGYVKGKIHSKKGKGPAVIKKQKFENQEPPEKLKENFHEEFEKMDFDCLFDGDDDFDRTAEPCKKSAKLEEKSSDKYGLLGSGKYPKGKDAENYFQRLPNEVVENIFCQLPMLDLCLNSNRVCTQWNRIISDEKFVPWKKLYHKTKADVGTARNDVFALIREHGMKSTTQNLTALVRYMKNFKPVTAFNMLQCLEKHGKYSWAKRLIEQKMPDCLKHKEPIPWCVITLLVILAHTVDEIEDIIRCLMVSHSQTTSKEILECLYCIATFLLAFQSCLSSIPVMFRKKGVWSGMHYRLFYALYLYENTSKSSHADLQSIMSSNNAGQQSLVKYSVPSESVQLTHEQLRIVKHEAGPRDVIKIVAFAGSGKTTTLVRYTQLRPNKKFLLVVYNKSVCENAKTKFPPNVECRTGHSLAYKSVGWRYRHKLGNLRLYTLTQVLQARKGENLYIQAKFALTTIENFLASADPEITTLHVPDYRQNEQGIREPMDDFSKRRYVSDAGIIWGKMQDTSNKLQMTHDGYLKLYQLSKPKLRQYDCILIDEAQDLTPAIRDLMFIQNQGKILVGDPHQQIYSFRGAVNIMETVQADHVFYLTQSFRFGPEIAHVARCCLEVLKKEKKKTLVGSGKKAYIDGTKVGQVAIICRCNFVVFSEAVKKCCKTDEDCKVAFIGGTTNFGFPMLKDMYALMLSDQERRQEGLEIQNKFVKMFDSLTALEAFATKCLDVELLGKIKIVKIFGHDLPLHIRQIQSKCVTNERVADYIFSTAHKAKGLEFSTVRITDDFIQKDPRYLQYMVQQGHLHDGDIRIYNGGEDSDESNLLYVAVTRAKNSLQMSEGLLAILDAAGENFLFPVLSEDLRQQGVTFTCTDSGKEFMPDFLTIQKKRITLATSQIYGGELYSPELLERSRSIFGGLLCPDKPTAGSGMAST